MKMSWLKMSWLLVLAAPVMAGAVFGADTIVWWTGAESNALNDWRNWGVASEAEAPFDTGDGNVRRMGFGKTPGADYTVTLTDDLVCNGSWWFGGASGSEKGYRVKFDLGGHALTFMREYSDHRHNYVTNELVNGTVAFTNSAGKVLTSRTWNQNVRGYSLTVGQDGKFIGNVVFQDGSPKYLCLKDNAQLRGAIQAKGKDSRVWIDGPQVRVDCDGGQLMVGGNGGGAAMYITDGATVTNVAKLSVGGDPIGAGVGDGSYLCISNAVFEMTLNRNAEQLAHGHYLRFTIGDAAASNLGTVSHCNRMDVIGGARASVGVNGVACPTQAVGDGYSHSNLLYVAGEGTVFSNATSFNADSPLISGMNGMHNRIWITDKAEAFVQSLSAGGQRKNYGNNCVTSLWNRVTVDGGAKLTATNLYVSTRHVDDRDFAAYLTSEVASNVFEVAGGAQVECVNDIWVGVLPPSRDNSFLVSGEGTALSVGGRLVVGSNGSCGNIFAVGDGAKATVGGDIQIGAQRNYDYLLESASNNVVRLDGCAFTNTTKTIQIGGYGNRGNRLWAGTGSDIAYQHVKLYGKDQGIIVSNGVFEARASLWYEGDETQTSNGVAEFWGENAKLRFTGDNYLNILGRGFKFVFHLPEGGYASAPFESTRKRIELDDSVEFEFDFSAVKRYTGMKWTELIRYSGTQDNGVSVSDALMAKIKAAALEANPQARVEKTADGKAIRMRVTKQGFTVIIR